MREIKLRAWNRESGRWEYYIIGQTFSDRLASYNEHCINGDIFYQYIGLKDKNGKEIYEGDIIDGMTVTYCGDQKAGLGMDVGWYLQRDDFESWILLMSRCNENGDNYEVIGNIYQNDLTEYQHPDIVDHHDVQDDNRTQGSNQQVPNGSRSQQKNQAENRGRPPKEG